MLMIVVKYLVTAGIVVAVSEIAKRTDKVGALIASLPMVTVMVMFWLWFEDQPTEKIANHAWYTFWYVIPTMPMFLLVPWMLQRGINFWLTMLAGMILTCCCFLLATVILRRWGIDLMP
jgi:hypothetical protein